MGDPSGHRTGSDQGRGLPYGDRDLEWSSPSMENHWINKRRISARGKEERVRKISLADLLSKLVRLPLLTVRYTTTASKVEYMGVDEDDGSKFVFTRMGVARPNGAKTPTKSRGAWDILPRGGWNQPWWGLAALRSSASTAAGLATHSITVRPRRAWTQAMGSRWRGAISVHRRMLAPWRHQAMLETGSLRRQKAPAGGAIGGRLLASKQGRVYHHVQFQIQKLLLGNIFGNALFATIFLLGKYISFLK